MPTQWSEAEQVPLGCIAPYAAAAPRHTPPLCKGRCHPQGDGGIVISRAGQSPAPTHAYRTRTLSLSCHSEPVTDVTGVGIRTPRPLPLPLGEVAERSEDGEGKQRRAASRRPFFQRVDKPILSFRGAPQGYLLRGAKRRGNPHSFSRKFAEKRKNCAIWEQIATPVCGLARNDGLFRQPVSTRSVDGGIVISRAGQSPAPTHVCR